MKTMRILLSAIALMAIASAQAQDVKWDKDKYPDYNPVLKINRAQQLKMASNIKKQKEEGKKRPDHVNNALSSAFPPVMNQSAGSCGSASRIYYMFAHEMNAARWADGSKAENIYPTHFTWLLTWCPGGQGKEIIAQHNGVPNSVVYGGYTYSDMFGYQDCDKQSDYGWMQGYDKWFHAMNNRIVGSANFPGTSTEEARELVKNYLWNHCGDDTYSTGGIVGVGVASSGNWQKIPKTTTNDALGVTGMYYVKNWGTSVDHALTIVGYDDRIEFDLDGNGIKGEADKDEVGAWIVVNSWGTGFCNGGFVYCPYAEGRPTKDDASYWGPEYYTPRRDYRPLRTIKVKMDYDHRSEIALYVGVSKNLNATAPEKETWLRHFYYAGLGKGVTVDASNPDPAIPMLGRWADGKLHEEPMEFGYDLTDLVSEYESGQPLKYFFRVETRAWAAGSGKIYAASIYDYTTDRDGVETPFEIGEEGIAISNAGAKTEITTTARAEKISAPRNLSATSSLLTWEAPVNASYAIDSYNIYKDGVLLTNVSGTTLSAPIEDYGSYTVSAVYKVNGYDLESQQSASIIGGEAPQTIENTFLTINDGQFTVPGFTTGAQDEYTIEFWVKPTSFANPSFGIKASSGKFFFYLDASRRVVVGYDGGDTGTSTNSLTADKWQHIAIVVKKTNITVYKTGYLLQNTSSILSKTSGYSNSGIAGSNDLWFGKTEGTNASGSYKQIINAPWNGEFDELRIWNYARSSSEIKKYCSDINLRPGAYSGLTHCYNMNTSTNGEGALVLIDSKGGHNVTLTTGEFGTGTNDLTVLPNKWMSSGASISLSNTNPIVGEAVTLTDIGSPSNAKWEWTITGSETAKSSSSSPVVVFNETGEQTITLTATNLKGDAATATKTVTVKAAETPVADFRLPEGEIAAGDHVTFINTSTPLDNATYKWTLEGAEVESLSTLNAAATYPANGVYTVRLEATTAAGTHSVEKQIEIVKVAPQAAFTIQNNVVMKGEYVNLIDNSKYEPEAWSWVIGSDSYAYLMEAQSGSVSFDRPGLYDVTLTASNDIGSSSLSRERAITVCNADGQTGLSFDNLDDEVVAGSPISMMQSRKVTVEWWMYPGAISSTCCAIGDAASTFLLTVGEDRAMTASIKNKTAKSTPTFIIPNEWHHYAVTFESSTSKVVFYRDGKAFSSTTISGTTNYAKWNSFRMGGTDAPMNAIIDELRIWKKALSKEELQAVINAPLENPAENSDLALYYDFNQSTGDVIDKSVNNLTGVRNNFGPDGDAWTSSKGIFCLNFDNNAADVSSTYLSNYVAPFKYTSAYVLGTSRFRKLAGPWVQENSVVQDNITTEFYVDDNKDKYMTLATTHDGFASAVPNLKLYQTITLPAGAYEWGCGTSRLSEWNPSANYLAAAEGVGLPDFNRLSAEALGYAPGNQSCKFVLTKETQVSLGVVSSQSGQACHTIMAFALHYTPLSVLEPIEVAVEAVQDELQAVPGVEAIGGLGSISITVSEPQRVDIFDLSGKLIWSEFVEYRSVVPVRKGLYIAGRQKVVVR